MWGYVLSYQVRTEHEQMTSDVPVFVFILVLSQDRKADGDRRVVNMRSLLLFRTCNPPILLLGQDCRLRRGYRCACPLSLLGQNNR